MTIKDQLRNYLIGRRGLSHGLADKISKSQSGGRTLRRLANEDCLYWFNAEPKRKNGYEYRVFAKSKLFINCEKDSDGWRLCILADRGCYFSKPYKTKTEALKQIKRSGI